MKKNYKVLPILSAILIATGFIFFLIFIFSSSTELLIPFLILVIAGFVLIIVNSMLEDKITSNIFSRSGMVEHLKNSIKEFKKMESELINEIPNTTNKTYKCPYCGVENDDSSSNCSGCGANKS